MFSPPVSWNGSQVSVCASSVDSHTFNVCLKILWFISHAWDSFKRSNVCVRYVLQGGTSGLQTGDISLVMLTLVESGSTGYSGIRGTLNIYKINPFLARGHQ